MSVTFRVDFDSPMKAFLKNGDKHIVAAAKQALLQEALNIMQDTKASGGISVDTGTLEDSGYIDTVRQEAGFTTEYAAYNHEGINRFTGEALDYPGGGHMKWLENILTSHLAAGPRIVAAEWASRVITGADLRWSFIPADPDTSGFYEDEGSAHEASKNPRG